MKENRPISLHQTLHGYLDGHSLLASSRDFPTDVRRTLLVLSDMSGQSMESGFESYLTAYPLESENLYAIARTWHAAEMPRSGCVWTHTLLVAFSDLELITDPKSLTVLFRRPSHDKLDRQSYETPIPFTGSNSEWIPNEVCTQHGLEDLAENLYSGDFPVFIGSDDAKTFEHLVLRIWSRQWPDLRQRFRFCSGAISSRSDKNETFDLQICPHSAWRQIQRTTKEACLVDLEATSKQTEKQAHWAHVVANDWYRAGVTEFQQFVNDFATHLEPKRVTCSLLARLFEIMQARSTCSSVREILKIIGQVFPEPREAMRFKVFAVRDNLWENGSSKTRGELLRAIAEDSASFDGEALRLSELSGELWDTQPLEGKKTISAITRLSDNTARRAIFSGVAMTIEPSQFAHMALVETAAACELIRSRPELAGLPDLWRHGADQHAEILRSLQDVEGMTYELKREVIEAQILAGAEDTIAITSKWAGKVFVDAVLSAMSTNRHESKAIRNWINSIKTQRKQVVSWITRNSNDAGPMVMEWCTNILEPDSKMVRDAPLKVWVDWSSRLHSWETSPTSSAAFFLIVGMSNQEDSAATIVGNAFPTVYAAAQDDQLSEAAWKQIKKQLGYSGWTWDRCKVLREGLVELFTDRNWPKSDFLSCTNDPEMLKAILKKWWSREESDYLQGIAEGLNHLGASSEQKRLFKKFL